MRVFKIEKQLSVSSDKQSTASNTDIIPAPETPKFIKPNGFNCVNLDWKGMQPQRKQHKNIVLIKSDALNDSFATGTPTGNCQ